MELRMRTRTYPINDTWQDDLADIIPEFGLELEISLAIEQHVLREACPVVSEPVARPSNPARSAQTCETDAPLIEWVIPRRGAPVRNAREELVDVVLVLILIEAVPALRSKKTSKKGCEKK